MVSKTIFNFFKNRTKNLFQYFKSLCRGHDDIPTLHKDEIAYSTNVAKAHISNKHFATVFVHYTEFTDIYLLDMAQSPYPDLSPIETATATKLI